MTTSRRREHRRQARGRATCKDFRLRTGFRSSTLHAVEDVSFTLAPGRTVALVGESGSGKSTIARISPAGAADLRRGAAGRRADGTAGLASAAYRRHVQMVFQDPFASLNPFHTIRTTWRGRCASTIRARTAPRSGAGRRAARTGQPDPGRPVRATLPARAVRRPAAAGRDRPRAGARPRVHRGRRAGVDARRVDPARRAQPARRPAARGAGWACCTSRTTSPRPALLRRDPRDVPGRDRRTRPGGRCHPRPAAPLHPALAAEAAATPRRLGRLRDEVRASKRGGSKMMTRFRSRNADLAARPERPDRFPAAARARPAEPVQLGELSGLSKPTAGADADQARADRAHRARRRGLCRPRPERRRLRRAHRRLTGVAISILAELAARGPRRPALGSPASVAGRRKDRSAENAQPDE